MSFFATNDGTKNQPTVSVDKFLSTPAELRRFNRQYNQYANDRRPFPADHRYIPTADEINKYAGTQWKQTDLGKIWVNNNTGGPSYLP